MDINRQQLIEVIVAVETEDPRIENIIARIKGGFNRHMEYKYQEALRRGKNAQKKREAIKPKPKPKKKAAKKKPAPPAPPGSTPTGTDTEGES